MRLALAALLAAAAPVSGWAAPQCIATRLAFLKIKPGMSADEAAAVVGCDARRVDTIDTPLDPTTILTWDSEAGYDLLNVYIVHGKVTMKAQSGPY